MSLIALAPDNEILVAPSSSLWWRANHTGGWLPLTGGQREVRMLVGAIDGEGWPWTTVERDTAGRWFQVLGTADACSLELGLFDKVYSVYAHSVSSRGWVAMPSECAWWIGAIRADEVLTASEASGIGWRWIHGLNLPDRTGLRAAHNLTHRA